MTTQRIDFLGLPLDTNLTRDDICDLVRQPGELRMLAFISPATWAIAKKYPDYLSILQQIPLISAGSDGVARVCRMLTGEPCTRLSFDVSSVASSFFKSAVAQRAKVMLVGGLPGIDERVKHRLSMVYPRLKLSKETQHGYGDFAPKIDVVLEQNPDVVVVSMPSPRQELFLLALRDAGYKGLAVASDGFFEDYLEKASHYPQWINRWNLRFAYRLLKHPRLLWRQYFVDYRPFVMQSFMALTHQWQSRDDGMLDTIHEGRASAS